MRSGTTVYQASVTQDAQVVADRRLRTTRRADQIADAHAGRTCSGDERQQVQTHRVGQRLKPTGQLGCGRLVERCAADRCAARHAGRGCAGRYGSRSSWRHDGLLH
jgi:hypothetical protein